MLRKFVTASAVVTLFSSLQSVYADDAGLSRVRAMLESGRETVRIVCFGDSVTGVYYHTGGRRAWPDMLRIALKKQYPKAKIEVFNTGVSGNTTDAALQRIERDVIAKKPHVVNVMFGLNDVVAGNRPAYRENLKTIIRRCRDAGAAVVLCTPNSVYPNAARPMSTVAEYAEIVRDVAQKESVALADCFRAYEDVRRRDATEWMLLMSEDIHPCMGGHRLFAETAARAISGESVSLADAPPLSDALQFTLARLKASQPVNVVAMPPYDKIVPDVLKEFFPTARVDVTTWPVEGQSLDAMEAWSKGIRAKSPTLVVLAVPVGANAKDDEAFIRSYNWIINWSTSYQLAAWDLMFILPNVTASTESNNCRHTDLARRIIAGYDAEYIDRKDGDRRSARQIVSEWVGQRMNKPHGD